MASRASLLLVSCLALPLDVSAGFLGKINPAKFDPSKLAAPVQSGLENNQAASGVIKTIKEQANEVPPPMQLAGQVAKQASKPSEIAGSVQEALNTTRVDKVVAVVESSKSAVADMATQEKLSQVMSATGDALQRGADKVDSVNVEGHGVELLDDAEVLRLTKPSAQEVAAVIRGATPKVAKNMNKTGDFMQVAAEKLAEASAVADRTSQQVANWLTGETEEAESKEGEGEGEKAPSAGGAFILGLVGACAIGVSVSVGCFMMRACGFRRPQKESLLSESLSALNTSARSAPIRAPASETSSFMQF